jgi:hypothetical protein
VCFDVPTQAAERRCKNSTVETCDAVERQRPKEVCDLVEDAFLNKKLINTSFL